MLNYPNKLSRRNASGDGTGYRLLGRVVSDKTNLVIEFDRTPPKEKPATVDFQTLSQKPLRGVEAGKNPPATTNQTNAAAGPGNSSKPVANPSGLSLVIRCTNDVLKVGDEIPIQFIISNQGAEDYEYQNPIYDRSGRMAEFYVNAKTTSGKSVHELRVTWLGRGIGAPGVLHPGESFSKFVPLNRWALINEPGRYDVVGTYPGNDRNLDPGPPVISDPISITVLPRTKEEMEDYIHGLSNQIAARLAIPADKKDRAPGLPDPDLERLLLKIAYTCSPEIVPTLIRTMYEARPWNR